MRKIEGREKCRRIEKNRSDSIPAPVSRSLHRRVAIRFGTMIAAEREKGGKLWLTTECTAAGVQLNEHCRLCPLHRYVCLCVCFCVRQVN